MENENNEYMIKCLLRFYLLIKLLFLDKNCFRSSQIAINFKGYKVSIFTGIKIFFKERKLIKLKQANLTVRL